MDANRNKEINKIKNVQFICGDVAKLVDDNINGDVLIVDPPRVGLDKHTVSVINNSGIEKIIYVSCDPMTLVRDIKEMDKYSLQDITGVEVKPSEESGKIMKYNSFRESGVAYTDKRGKTENTAFLDSKNYKYGVMDENSASAKIEALVQAIGTDEEAIEPF